MARLIVNADDFGLTSGVNRAITGLHTSGALTSTTLMARALATDEAVQLALTTPTLGVGCHVVLVDGEPLLSPAEKILADPTTGRFRPKLGGFLRWLHGLERDGSTARQRAAQIEAEAEAQIRSLLERGVRLSHIDTHKHTHMFPAVLRPVLRAAKRAGLSVVRNPFEPAWSVAATPAAPWLRRMEVNTLRLLEGRFKHIVCEEGFVTTDGALGVLATGTLDEAAVDALLEALPTAGTFELVSHPGYNDADLAHANTRLLASREQERTALARVLAHPQVELASFAAIAR
ncbi:ChbG/HpnK family deacetylase [Telmatobacter bradus]|uniref:ChbG/HpnK family deacetylase n=1 Tax=Telmatobacter bradus TaxID=474953 RepID=UPI003B43211B